MSGPRKVIYKKALRHVTMFKSAILLDVVAAMLLTVFVGVAALIINSDKNLTVLLPFCILWSILFSRHSSRLMPSTSKSRLFLFGFAFLFMASLASILSDIAIGGIFNEGLTIDLLKVIVASSVISIAIIVIYPYFLNFIVKKEQQSIRAGYKQRPYYMFGVFFLIFFVVICIPVIFGIIISPGTHSAWNVILSIIASSAFFFSAIIVSSIFFAVYKEGHPFTK